MKSSYVLIDSKSRQIKLDTRTRALCVFDSLEDASKVKSNYLSDSDVSIVKCEMSFSNQEIVK